MGQHPQSFEKEITKTLRANCLLYVPEQYLTSQKEWPLILFLHGAGERGNDLSKVEIHGPPKLIAKENKEFPFVIVSPQCPKDGWWSSELQIDVCADCPHHEGQSHEGTLSAGTRTCGGNNSRSKLLWFQTEKRMQGCNRSMFLFPL